MTSGRTRGKSARRLACYARFNQNARFYISEILPVEPGDFHICPRSGNVTEAHGSMLAARGAAPLQGTLIMQHGMVHFDVLLTRVVFCLAGDDGRLEGGLLRDQVLLVFIFQRLLEIMVRFGKSAEEEVSRECEYVGRARL